MDIVVIELYGPECLSEEDGQDLFGRLHSALSQGLKVRLDFEGVRIAPSCFLNPAVGQLLSVFNEQELSERLNIINATGVVLATLHRVLKNAREYFSDDAFKAAVDEAAARCAEEEE